MKKKVLLGVLAFASAFCFVVSVSADRDQGVDLSKYQGSTAVFGQASDKFAICQIGGYYDGIFYPQSTYQSQVASTIAQGKRAHTYIFSEFSTRAQADQMLDYYLPKVQTPKNSIVALDVESGTPNTDAVMYALVKVKQAGYTPVLYGYLNFLKAHLDLSTIADSYPLWLAEYPDYQVRTTPDYNYFPSYKNIHMFQFTSTYKAGGLDGNVDLLGITKNGYNGTTTNSVGATTVKTTTTTAAIKQGQTANATSKSDIAVGYTVKVNFSASKWSNDSNIPSWVKGKSYKAQQVSGSKVLLAGILSWIDKSNVEILQTARQATSTSTSSSSLPSGVHAQSGTFTPNQSLMVWHGAGYNATYQYYYRGESIKYVGYIDNWNAGYRYIVYKGASGIWCYVADRHLSPNYMLGYAK
ncbi:GH25 family lysozyme [Liquorilactobacillus nagelii]|uniref:GH25 family lysozyme n=1 Tax=Liquorilactobacillus nagelii TaxID=82688 RepID=UPI0006EFC216|nr:GH25 family lysozyme [Liquorilactobacillus nagelii]KRL39931.1 lys44 [Liquorilactobacillus nagelii DSM 13675]QYH53448.1 1,4-beta-N-acetylmuramidase [Liquorilactobacillus nagelii DSM 13675]